MMSLKDKLMSRKFWLSVAALLGSMGTMISGIVTSNSNVTTMGALCAAMSAGIYAVCEALVDYAAVDLQKQDTEETEADVYLVDVSDDPEATSTNEEEKEKEGE